MVNIQPVAQYQQGVPRDTLYRTRYDFMWPILSETGEQELFTAEIDATNANVTSRKIFGFEPRYNHLRFGEKTVHGDFRTNLSGYHAGRIFTEEPNLNENFVECVPTKRMFAVELQDVDAFVITKPSVVEHIGKESAMGHIGADVSCDFGIMKHLFKRWICLINNYYSYLPLHCSG